MRTPRQFTPLWFWCALSVPAIIATMLVCVIKRLERPRTVGVMAGWYMGVAFYIGVILVGYILFAFFSSPGSDAPSDAVAKDRD
jgi:hypothetical protein